MEESLVSLVILEVDGGEDLIITDEVSVTALAAC